MSGIHAPQAAEEGERAGGGDSKDPASLVSVVVSAYNVAVYLGRALDSALAQTMSDLEVIVVDDASTDSTLEVARRVSERDPRVRVLRNERNAGPAASRNRAIGEARGEWIALLDGDDAWSPRRLEHMLAHAGGADVVGDDVRVVRESSVGPDLAASWSLLREQGLVLHEPRLLDALDFARHDLGLLQPIMRRSVLLEHGIAYGANLRYNEDFLLYFDLLASGARWLQLPDAYYLYYKHDEAITRDKGALWRSAAETTQVLLRHPVVVGNPALTDAMEDRIREARGHIAFADARDALRKRGLSGLARVLREKPSELPLLARFVVERLHARAARRVRALRDRSQRTHHS